MDLDELSRVLPGYERRASQQQMLGLVEQALAKGEAAVVEAGTGTGKTLAYLLPAARSGLKVVVCTATKNLQEQLADKDVPLLKALGVDARVAFLKGRQNYLCLLRFEQFERNPTFAVRDEAALFESISEWAAKTQTGDRAELEELPENLASWRDLSASADQCLGQKCAHFDRCFVFRMRRLAAEADVVVVNHHLFFADLALRSSSAGDAGAAVLPRYDAVIFDEAHAARGGGHRALRRAALELQGLRAGAGRAQGAADPAAGAGGARSRGAAVARRRRLLHRGARDGAAKRAATSDPHDKIRLGRGTGPPEV